MPYQSYRHVRKHWKKYVVGQLVGALLTSYFIRKLRERNVIREYCSKAKSYGEEKTGMLDQPKRLMVFLNGYANNLDAKSKFNKYVAPLLHLSGVDVTVVESQYRGHLKELMEYVDPTVDGIVVAGGDGTILEVLNGLRQRKDVEKVKSIPVGLLPLGTENNSFMKWFPSLTHQSQARKFGEASIKIIQGLTRQVPTMSLQPEKGKTVYAVSSVEWGAFKDAWRNRNRFKLFGKLRLLLSHINVALQHWPDGCAYTLCIAPQHGGSDSADLMIGTRLPINPDSAGSGNVDWLTVVKEVELPGWTKREGEDLVGFKIQPSVSTSSLTVHMWPASAVTKGAFINHGWQQTVHGDEASGCDGIEEEARQIILVPEFSEGWLSVDGEEYESLAMAVTVEQDSLTLFT